MYSLALEKSVSSGKIRCGQQQRLCIARALVLRPDAFLMDEPCSALDPVSTGGVEELIQPLSVNYAIVMATHNLRQARRLSSVVAFFWLLVGIGKLIESRIERSDIRRPEKRTDAALRPWTCRP